jgi:acid phosphatase (class A)
MIRRSRTVVGILIVLMLTLVTVQHAAAQQDDAVIAIDIALEPGQAMEDRAHAANAALLADFPKGFALDATHHAHVTLLQCYVRTADLDKVYAAANGVLAKEDVAHWKLKATKYSSLILGPIGAVVIDVEATPDLVRLQRELIEALEPFTVKTGTTAAFYTTPDEPDIIPFLIDYVATYVSKSSGDNFHPHVTAGVANADFVKTVAAGPFEPITFSPDAATVYQLGDYGTARKLLQVLDQGPAAQGMVESIPLPPGYLPGYLAAGKTPNSLSLLPPPPGLGSAAQARDDTAAMAAVARSGGPRWMQAVEDADLHFPKVAETFSCAVGVRITEADTPRLYVLLRRSLVDAGLSTYPTKIKYQRVRPFMVDGRSTCTPGDEAALRKDGSYPSGHSAVGWAWALILVEAAPERAEAILARGRAFGQSRVECNAHWLSDTEEGRVMASGVVARLHDDAAFRDDLAAARSEIAAARAAGLGPTRDCARETAQLGAE